MRKTLDSYFPRSSIYEESPRSSNGMRKGKSRMYRAPVDRDEYSLKCLEYLQRFKRLEQLLTNFL
jgi:hypothetical protein